MIQAKNVAERRIGIIGDISSVLANEFLFCVFYQICEWNRPISVRKLARDLGSEDDLIRDHLNILIHQGLIQKEGEKYRISESGKEGINFLREATGRVPRTDRRIITADVYSEVVHSPLPTVAKVNIVNGVAQPRIKVSGGIESEKTFDSLEASRVPYYQEITENAT